MNYGKHRRQFVAKAFVVYATRAGATRKIAEIVAEGIRLSGEEATVINITSIKTEKDLSGYDAYVLGSATYHGEMLQAMKTMLFLAEKANLKDKIGGAFGAFGWSGEAPDRIYDTMKNIFQMDMTGGPLRLKSVSLMGGVKMAQDYGKEIAEKMNV
jgi:flavorubredoxin